MEDQMEDFVKQPVLLILLLVTLASCAGRSPQASDTVADTQLGADTVAAEDAESTLEEFEDLQRREQKRNLERVINEPDLART